MAKSEDLLVLRAGDATEIPQKLLCGSVEILDGPARRFHLVTPRLRAKVCIDIVGIVQAYGEGKLDVGFCCMVEGCACAAGRRGHCIIPSERIGF